VFKIDGEIIQDLIKTSESILSELEKVMNELKMSPANKELYEKFGQQIDRIYGTLSTIGMTNIAEYTMMLKKVGYACSQYEEKTGRARTMNLMENAVANLKIFNDFLKNPKDKEKAKLLKIVVDREKDKAILLMNTIYKGITRTTTNK